MKRKNALLPTEAITDASPVENASPKRLASTRDGSAPGLVVGELVALFDGGRTPLVIFPGQPGTGAITARSLIDLSAEHIGAQLALMFEGGNLARPTIMGRVREHSGVPLPATARHVELEADGRHLMVTAQERVTIQCGEASITLTRDGTIELRGTHVVSRASGSQRIKGGSVQIN